MFINRPIRRVSVVLNLIFDWEKAGATNEANGDIKDDERLDEIPKLVDENNDAGGTQKRTRNTKRKRITRSHVEPHFEKLPLEAVAKLFGVGRTTFRTRCRELGITKWPYDQKRKVKTVRNQGNNVNTAVVCHQGNVNTVVRDQGNVNIVSDQGNVNTARDQGDVNIVNDRLSVPETQINQTDASETNFEFPPVYDLENTTNLLDDWYSMDINSILGLGGICEETTNTRASVSEAQFNQNAADVDWISEFEHPDAGF